MINSTETATWIVKPDHFLNKEHQDPFNRAVLSAIDEQIKSKQDANDDDLDEGVPF